MNDILIDDSTYQTEVGRGIRAAFLHCSLHHYIRADLAITDTEK